MMTSLLSTTRLVYLVHRYYDPTTGQFLTVDPDLQETLQPYSYSSENPVSGNDPTGEEDVFDPCADCGGGENSAGGTGSGEGGGSGGESAGSETGVNAEGEDQADEDQIAEYRASLETKAAGGSGPNRAFQVYWCGSTEYRVVGGGARIFADNITNTGWLQDAKFVGNPAESPYVPGSSIDDLPRSLINAGTADEFERYGKVLNSGTTPLVGLEVITNSAAAAEYFNDLMADYDVPGYVRVVSWVELPGSR